MAHEYRKIADELLRDGIDNIDRAASILAGVDVSPETARELEGARELLANAKERERRRSRVRRVVLNFSL